MKVPEKMPEIPTAEDLQPKEPLPQGANEPKISRRKFLGYVAKIAATAVVASIPDSLKQPPLTPEQGAQLRKEVEERFNIKLLDEDQLFLVSKGAPACWDVQKLKQLNRVLPSLPEYFYKPDPNTKLNLTLVHYGGNYLGMDTVNIIENGKEELRSRVKILVGIDVFDKGDAYALSLLAHEITHYLDDRDRPLFRAINERIFEGKFSEVEGELQTRAREMSKQYQKFFLTLTLIPPHLVPREKSSSSRFEYMLQRAEFVPVLAGQYVGGKQQFFNAFTGLFGQEKVEQLYDFTRREIFRGREY